MPKKVIRHEESDADHLSFINKMRGRGLGGLAVKPATTIEKFRHIAGYEDTLLFMIVVLGRCRSPLEPEVLGKVSIKRKRFPSITFTVNDRVSLDNLPSLLNAWGDVACAGSRVFLKERRKDNYRLFQNRLLELEGIK
jgi:pentose-5-phosphate-3-epimerase